MQFWSLRAPTSFEGFGPSPREFSYYSGLSRHHWAKVLTRVWVSVATSSWGNDLCVDMVAAKNVQYGLYRVMIEELFGCMEGVLTLAHVEAKHAVLACCDP